MILIKSEKLIDSVTRRLVTAGVPFHFTPGYICIALTAEIALRFIVCLMSVALTGLIVLLTY